jgi:heme exporter protein C
MWIGMMVCYTVSVIYSIKFLRKPSPVNDIYANEYAITGTIFGVLGLVTGMIWAHYQWGKAWSGDPKQNGAAIAS